ncbi:hypothetical protein TYRP_016498 [Tyrophagus putrescentiae]|nr:hypothetical protein TYRP_016498 [Tyrophagus putrescentiae]
MSETWTSLVDQRPKSLMSAMSGRPTTEAAAAAETAPEALAAPTTGASVQSSLMIGVWVL